MKNKATIEEVKKKMRHSQKNFLSGYLEQKESKRTKLNNLIKQVEKY